MESGYTEPSSFCLLDKNIQTFQPYPRENLPKTGRFSRKLNPWFCGYGKDYDRGFMKECVYPHIASYNEFLQHGINEVTKYIEPVVCGFSRGQLVRLTVTGISVGRPCVLSVGRFERILPAVCREAGVTYSSPISITIKAESLQMQSSGQNRKTTVEGEREYKIPCGLIPMMVQSRGCHLYGMDRNELIQAREDERDAGGYFIINGNERILRVLQIPRRHIPTTMIRTAYEKRGNSFTQYGISFRSVRSDERSQTIVLHALKDGSACVRILIEKREYFLPLVLLLRALRNTTDREIFMRITNGNESDSYLVEHVEMLLRESHRHNLWQSQAVLGHLGHHFRVALRLADRSDLTDEEVGEILIQRHVLWHLGDDNTAKFNLLCDMCHRLYALTAGKIQADNPDAVSYQELLLPGNLYQMMLSELIEDAVFELKGLYDSKFASNLSLDTIIGKKFHPDIGNKFDFFLATGNMRTRTGLDLMQVNGFTVVADRLNYVRFMAHFRSIHRGAFFSDMKTTTVRKLLPESFGFVCCVHTPDGGPCGLLNHLGHTCKPSVVNATESDKKKIRQAMFLMGVTPISLSEENEFTHSENKDENEEKYNLISKTDKITVMLDGCIIGSVPSSEVAQRVADKLRLLKCKADIYQFTEIVFIPPENKDKLYPSLMVFTNKARMIRPVMNLCTGSVEFLSTLEQIFLDISIYGNAVIPGITTHQELTPMTMLSVTACMTPFSDHNQSPRNMYQCQMIKQTMGFYARSVHERCDNKSYHIMTPQRPVVRNSYIHDKGGFDTHPTGTNAVVAVASYTGYDMEDAVLLNKSSVERGMFHGVVYTTHDLNLVEMGPREKRNEIREASESMYKENKLNTSKKQPQDAVIRRFCNIDKEGNIFCKSIDIDGLPTVGTYLTKGDPLAVIYDPFAHNFHIEEYEKGEPGWVDKVVIAGVKSMEGQHPFVIHARVVIRHDRTPIIGDKLSSRHGQKGTLGIKWPQRDMPWSADGICPDVIINPHAFPSRMTIGMLIESLAGKQAVYNGTFADSTPFQWSDDRRAIDYFGDALQKCGYSRFGSETLYSGITGEPMPCEIFIGVVYYQRLRHMVTDKYQVRAKGKVDQVTKQPVKGRKRGGGIRFGEMERDALIGHGAMNTLRCRLCTDSDAMKACVCKNCGSILSYTSGIKSAINITDTSITCRACGSAQSAAAVEIPAITAMLAFELASLGIKLKCKVDRN